MAHKGQHERAIARLERRPAAGSQGAVVTSDPITVGPDRTINVDLGKLPAPAKEYDADFAWIVHQVGRISLFFAKRDLNQPDKLRTRLEVRYPPENLVGNLWRNSREFHARLRKYVERWPADEQRDSVDPSKMVSARDHSECANFEAMAHAGTESAIDFYSMPAAGIARYASGQGSSGLTFTPIVRVQLSVFELIRLLDATTPVVEQINAYLPKLESRALQELEENAK